MTDQRNIMLLNFSRKLRDSSHREAIKGQMQTDRQEDETLLALVGAQSKSGETGRGCFERFNKIHIFFLFF